MERHSARQKLDGGCLGRSKREEERADSPHQECASLCSSYTKEEHCNQCKQTSSNPIHIYENEWYILYAYTCLPYQWRALCRSTPSLLPGYPFHHHSYHYYSKLYIYIAQSLLVYIYIYIYINILGCKLHNVTSSLCNDLKATLGKCDREGKIHT